MMRLKVLAVAAAIAGGLGLASVATAAPLTPASAGVVAGDATPTNVTYYGYGYGRGYGPGYGFYRPRPLYRPYGFYGPRRFYGPRYGFYGSRPFYRPSGFYGPRFF